ncbi:unnamed protein product [Diabrotica balteata]|uniref:Uncharacterized protein n=1 Tax=Diabrotica balteata TaxID=107213 RepID=A0A9N9SM98_DIABA|nr:unnamed protein product [Diabrotica balteata]
MSRKAIPRGCRQQYVPGMSSDSNELMKTYETLYFTDPFSQETVDWGAVYSNS